MSPPKLGFALWDHPRIAVPLELALLVVGFGVYLSRTRAIGPWGRRLPWVVMALLLAFQCINWFGPLPADHAALSTFALLGYALCAALAWLLERTRTRLDT
jgi:hypothetical protein